MSRKGADSGDASGADTDGRGEPGARRRMEADRQLQLEINRALEDLADSLPGIEDLRLPRVLLEVLEPSWAEHVSFQQDALFPIVLRRHAGVHETAALIDRLRREHAEIADRHVEVRQQIVALVQGRRTNDEAIGYLLRGTFEYRGRHLEQENAIEALLPRLLTPADGLALDEWSAKRPRPLFPVLYARTPR